MSGVASAEKGIIFLAYSADLALMSAFRAILRHNRASDPVAYWARARRITPDDLSVEPNLISL